MGVVGGPSGLGLTEVPVVVEVVGRYDGLRSDIDVSRGASAIGGTYQPPPALKAGAWATLRCATGDSGVRLPYGPDGVAVS